MAFSHAKQPLQISSTISPNLPLDKNKYKNDAINISLVKYIKNKQTQHKQKQTNKPNFPKINLGETGKMFIRCVTFAYLFLQQMAETTWKHP